MFFWFVTICLKETNSENPLNKEDKQWGWCILKIPILWDVMLCQLVNRYLNVKGTVIPCSAGNCLSVNTAQCSTRFDSSVCTDNTVKTSNLMSMCTVPGGQWTRQDVWKHSNRKSATSFCDLCITQYQLRKYKCWTRPKIKGHNLFTFGTFGR
jgi:hypothetical protein